MKDASEPRLDRFGDPLPGRVLVRLGTARFRHGWHTSALAAGPDGSRLASGDRFGGICLWEVPTGRPLWRAHGPGGISVLAFSPDGEGLASGGHDGVVLRDVATGRQVGSYHDTFRRTSRSPTGDGSGGSEGRDYELEFIDIGGLAFSPDGRSVAAADFIGVACVWDLATGERRLTLWGEPLGNIPFSEDERFCSLAYSPDGTLLAVGSWYEVGMVTGREVSVRGEHGRVLLWEVATGRRLRVLDRPGGIPLKLAFSPGGETLVSVNPQARDRMAFAWDVATGRELWRASLDAGEWPQARVALPNEPAMSADRRFASSTATATRSSCRTASDPSATRASGTAVSLHLRSLTTGQDLGPRPRLPGPARCLAFSRDDSVLAVAVPEEDIFLWEVASGRIVGRLGYRQEYPRHSPAIAFGPRYLAIVSRDDATEQSGSPGVRVIEWATGSRVCEVGDVRTGSLAWLAGDEVLAIGTHSGEIRLIEAASGRGRTTLPGHQVPVIALASSPDGLVLASGDAIGTIRVWDWESGRVLRTMTDHGAAVMALAFSPDVRGLVAAYRGGLVTAWDLADGAVLHSFHSPEPPDDHWPGQARDVGYSASGAALFVASYQVSSSDEQGREREQYQAVVWDVVTGLAVLRTPRSPGPFVPLAFTRDARGLATASHDGTVLIWDLEAGGR